MFVKKKGKGSFFKALYSKRGWKRLLPLKILGGMPAVGSVLHRWMWGTQSRLEQLMAPCNLQRVRSNHSRTCEPKINWSYLLKIKTPLSSSDGKEKLEFWGAIMGTRAQNNILGLGPCPRTLTSSRRETRLRSSTLQASPVGDKGEKVRGGTPPRTRQTQTKCILKQLKHAPWTREREENSKYLRKSCHHHIKYTTATFLAALMWWRPLNNATLATATHRGLKGVFDGMGTQVGIQVINKCKV